MAAAKQRSVPTYPLAEVHRLASTVDARFVTGTAERDAWAELGLKRDGIFRIVAALTTADFYKSMPSEQNPGTFQDVYRPTCCTPLHQGGVQLYCKVQVVTKRIVISFKLR